MDNDNDLIRRGDALECFMGLDRIGDIKDEIAALPAAPMGRKAKFVSDHLRAMMDRDPESKMFGLSADVLRHIIEALS